MRKHYLDQSSVRVSINCIIMLHIIVIIKWLDFQVE